jgi:hypothetical protein
MVGVVKQMKKVTGEMVEYEIQMGRKLNFEQPHYQPSVMMPISSLAKGGTRSRCGTRGRMKSSSSRSRSPDMVQASGIKPGSHILINGVLR